MYRVKFIVSRITRLLSAIVILMPAAMGQDARSQTGSKNERILARVGDRFIDEREFRERFELTPGLNRRRGAGLKEEKEAVVYSLIAEKLLALEGIDAGLDKDPSFLEAVLELRKLVARDQLYREEIVGKVRVSRTETATGIAQSKRQLTVSFMFSEDRTALEFIRSQIRQSSDFEKIVIDSSMGVLRDTATIIWGDADWDIEREAYGLKRNTVSGVIEAGSGYYILRTLKEEPSVYFTSLSGEALQLEIERTIRLRKERARLDEFVRSTLKDKKGYAIRAAVRSTALAIAMVLERAEFASDSTLTPEIVDATRRQIAEKSSDSIAVAGETVWSIENVLQKLSRTNLHLASKKPEPIFGLLMRQLMIWVQQELLAQEALRRRVDETPECARKLEIWRDAMLASRVKARVSGGSQVIDGDIWTYAASKWNLRVPMVTIRELWASSLSKIQVALEELKEGKSFKEIVVEYSENGGKAAGETVSFPVTSRPPLGGIAYSLAPGTTHGPLKVGGKFLLFELLDKDTLTFAGSGMTVEQIREAKRETMRMKQRATVNQYLAALGKKRGFTIFQDQIRKIEVSPMPMMSFRILGFGGRMMEVPFIDRQLEWLNTDVPEDLIP